nr:MAG TPA: hypothetical protein [Caudoviricetes sp.]
MALSLILYFSKTCFLLISLLFRSLASCSILISILSPHLNILIYILSDICLAIPLEKAKK